MAGSGSKAAGGRKALRHARVALRIERAETRLYTSLRTAVLSGDGRPRQLLITISKDSDRIPASSGRSMLPEIEIQIPSVET